MLWRMKARIAHSGEFTYQFVFYESAVMKLSGFDKWDSVHDDDGAVETFWRKHLFGGNFLETACIHDWHQIMQATVHNALRSTLNN